MKYITTLLVDDDYLVLQDLKKLVDWNDLGFQIIGAASNGKTALRAAQKLRPDLVITDISMPVMDGFDFIEEIRRFLPDTYIVFISSYADFDYAKRAMKNGIRDYILKNELSAESLRAQLVQIRNYLRKQDTSRHQDLRLRIEEYFTSSPETVLTEDLPHHRYLFFFFSWQLPLEKLKPHFQRTSEWGNRLLLLLQERIRPLYPQALFFHLEELAVVGIRPRDLGETPSLTAVSRICRKITTLIQTDAEAPQKLLGAFFPNRLSISECRILYKQLLPQIQFQISFPGNFQEDLSTLAQRKYIPMRQAFPYQLLPASLKHPETYYQQLDVFLTELFQARDAESLFMLYHNLLLQMEELSGHLLHDSGCRYFSNQTELAAFLRHSYEEIRRCPMQSSLEACSSTLSQAMEYMKQNYSNSGLTIEQIAASVSLSSSRLSVLFKQETGQTVGDYLTSLRISQAIYLLENTNLKIYEIAERTGYKSSQYFSQVFSQKTGRKPLRFRQKKPL